MFEYAREVAMHPAVEQEFEPRYRELRGPDGSYLQVRVGRRREAARADADAGDLDEYCEAKDDELYTALRTALLPGATMFTVTTAGVGRRVAAGAAAGAGAGAAGHPRPRLRSRTPAGPNIRMLEWMVPEDVDARRLQGGEAGEPALADHAGVAARAARGPARDSTTSASTSTDGWGGSAAGCPPGAWQACANGVGPIAEGSRIWVGVDIGGARADTAIVWLDEQFRVGCRIWSGDDALMDATAFLPGSAQRYRIVEVVYDPWRAQTLAKIAEQHGIKVTAFPQ